MAELQEEGAAGAGRFPTPFERHRVEVRPEWIDGQGHMNVGYYGLLFDEASYTLLVALGLGRPYGDAHRHGTFVVESHMLHEGELIGGESAGIRSWILSADEKRLHIGHELVRDRDGRRVAAQEIMYLHVDLDSRRVVPFLPVVRDAIIAAWQTHAAAARPEWPGRRIAPARADGPFTASP